MLHLKCKKAETSLKEEKQKLKGVNAEIEKIRKRERNHK